MNIRLTTAAGFLAAASLLSGSAFAFAPEFTGDLPTVIITDQLEAPSSTFDLAQPGNATSGIFRYTGAFDLYDYIDGGALTSGEKNLVRWAFTETKITGIETVGTLIINDEEAVTTVPANLSDLTAAGTLVGADGTLDFWNKDFSGTDTTLSTPPVTPFDYVGQTGHDLVASGPQERIVTIYVGGDESTIDFTAFTVITKIGEGDSISEVISQVPTGPVDPFVNAIPTITNFAGWTQFSLDNFSALAENSNAFDNFNNTTFAYQGGPGAALPGATVVVYGNSATTAGKSWTPSASPAPAAATLTAAISGSFNGANGAGTIPKIGMATWETVLNTPIDGNNLYRVRTRIARSNANLRDVYRIRVGNATTYGNAITSYQSTLDNTKAYLTTTPDDHYTYLLAKTSTVGNTDLGISIDAYSLGSLDNAFTNPALAGSGLVISEVEVSKAARTALGAPTVLINRGGAIPTLAAGELTTAQLGVPASGESAFLIANSAAGFPRAISNIGANTTRQPRTATVVSGGINFVIGAGTGATFPQNITFGPFGTLVESGWSWASFFEIPGWNVTAPSAANNPTSPGLFTVAENKIYIADVYLSSPQATGGADEFPTLRLRIQNTGSQESQAVFDLGEDGNGVKIATAPKVYSVVARPNSLAGPVGTNAHLFVDFYSVGLSARSASVSSRTVTIHRIIISEYNNIIQ